MKMLMGSLAVLTGLLCIGAGIAMADEKKCCVKDEMMKGCIKGEMKCCMKDEMMRGCMKAGDSMDTIKMAAAAKVTIDQAIKTASDKVAGKVVEAELEKKYDKLVWEVEVVTAENKVMEVHIDVTSGEVIATEEK